MSRRVFILCLIVFALATQEIQGSSLETLSNAWASQYGEVSINKDAYGFYVDVDYAYYPSSSANMTKMLLGLSNSETLLTKGCATFDTYDCSRHNCTEYTSWTSNIDYPSLSTLAYHVTTDAYLDYANWKLKTYAYITKACTYGSSLFGAGRGGIIGLGTESGSWQNFISSGVFSIFMEKNLNGGKLLFRYDPSLAASISPVVLNTDNNWRYSFSSGQIRMGYYTSYFSGTLIFDPHAKAIGFPQSTFQTIVSYLQSTQGITCSSDNTNPTCNYNGYVSGLPILKLVVNSIYIDLPPSVYVKGPATGYERGITLNLQALSPNLGGSNYVSDTFKNAVIMDSQFMSYYYLVFGNSQVKLYVQGTPSPKINGKELYILCVVGFILVTSVCVCICKKKKKSAKLPLPSSQDPSMMNQPSNNPVPVQPNNGYVYPQNNNPAVHQNGQYGQYAQQPAGYVRQPAYYPPLPTPQQQFQQPGNVNYGA